MSKIRKAVAGLALAATAGSGAVMATAGTAHAQETAYACRTVIIEKGIFVDTIFETINRNCGRGEAPGTVVREYI
jgi:hypothetical protein